MIGCANKRFRVPNHSQIACFGYFASCVNDFSQASFVCNHKVTNLNFLNGFVSIRGKNHCVGGKTRRSATEEVGSFDLAAQNAQRERCHVAVVGNIWEAVR